MARSAAEPTSPRQAHTSARDYDVDMELLDRLIVSSPAALRAGLAHNWPALPPAPFIPVAHRIELLALFSAAVSSGSALNAKVPALNLFFPQSALSANCCLHKQRTFAARQWLLLW